MPDDVVFWKMRLTRTEVSAANSEHGDRDKLGKLVQLDCRPPPGAMSEFVRPDAAPPLIITRFVQEDEKRRLAAIGGAMGPQFGFYELMVSIILAQLGFRTVQIEYGKPYTDLLVIEPCYKKSVYLHVTYRVYEVKVAAAVAVTVGGVTFPAGDELATLRAAQPLAFRFETVHEWDPECCPERPPRVVDSHTEWDPPEAEWRSFQDWLDDRTPFHPWQYRVRVKRSFE